MMINPYYFTNKNLKTGSKTNLESQNIELATSILTISPIFPEFAIDFRYSVKIIKKLSVIHARLINHHKCKYHTIFQLAFIRIMKVITEVMK